MNCSEALKPPREHGGLKFLAFLRGCHSKNIFGAVAAGGAGSSGGQSPNKIKFNDSGVITVQIWNMIKPTVTLCTSLLTFFASFILC